MLDWLLQLDTVLFRAMAQVQSPAVDLLMVTLTGIGESGMVFFAPGLLAIALRPARAPGFMQLALAIGLAGGLTDFVIKPWIARERPYIRDTNIRVMGKRPASHSFISGHAANAGAGALAVSGMWPAMRPFLWLLGALIALSRVYVGVHYPSDVVIGFLVGAACGYFATGGTVWDRRWLLRAASPPPGR